MSQQSQQSQDLKADVAANQRVIDDLNARLERKTKEIRVIQTISGEINTTLDLGRVFDIILDSMRDLFGFQHSLILLKQEGAKSLQVVASRGYESDGRGAVVPFGQGVIGVVAARRKMMRMAGLAYRGRYVQSAVESSGGTVERAQLPGLPNVQCQIAIPLLMKDELIGVFAVESDQVSAFDALDELLISIVGSQMGGAIANARAYQAVEEMKANLERRVEERTEALNQERSRSEQLLCNILPTQVAEELKKGHGVEPLFYESVSVMFTDFVGFTTIAERMRPDELVKELDGCFSQFDAIVDRHGIEKLKTIGDAYMCVGGIPGLNWTHPVDACIAGLEFQRFMGQMATIKQSMGVPYWELRVGIHTGPVTAGVIGTKKFAYDVWGDTVNVASRMESAGAPGEINISSSTYEVVREFFECESRGALEAKGKGAMEMYFVRAIKPALSVDASGLIPNDLFFEMRAALEPRF